MADSPSYVATHTQTFVDQPYHLSLTSFFAFISAPLAINSSAVAVCPVAHANINAAQFF
jgi:hypothetical protein